MLDTNVYEFILKKLDKGMLDKLVASSEIIIYGNDLIRKELRDISKKKVDRVDKRIIKLRSTLLSIYDLLVGRHNYRVGDDMIKLAERYFTVYKTLGGNISKENIIKDFIIVACASIKQLDIVVSEDNRTMLSELSVKTYEVVNMLEGKRTPKFIGFGEFTEEIRRCVSL